MLKSALFSLRFCQSQHTHATIADISALGDNVTFRFAHCGDFHLGYDFGYLPSRKAAARQADLRVAFFRSVRETLKWGAQVFLISGDLFDTPHPSARDVEIVSKNLAHLSKKGVRCFAIPGNHDPVHSKSVWNQPEIQNNLHLFHDDPAAELAQENIAELNLTIAGIHPLADQILPANSVPCYLGGSRTQATRTMCTTSIVSIVNCHAIQKGVQRQQSQRAVMLKLMPAHNANSCGLQYC